MTSSDTGIFRTRYKLMLVGMAKEAKKQLKALEEGLPSTTDPRRTLLLRRFEETCREAVRAMHEVGLYVSIYKRDTDYKASVRKLEENIVNMRRTTTTTTTRTSTTATTISSAFPSPGHLRLDTDYGELHFEGRMLFRKHNQTRFAPRYLMCFQARILIFSMVFRKDEEAHGVKVLVSAQ